MKRITIVTDDRPGVVADVADAMAAAGINIEHLAGEAVGDSAVVALCVDRYDDALRALSQTPLHAVSDSVIVVKLFDRPGELARITHRFKDARINLRSIRILRRGAGMCVVAVEPEDVEAGTRLLADVAVA